MAAVGFGWRFEETDQFANRMMAVLRVPERELSMHLVGVPASDAGLGQMAGLLEVADDLSDRSLGDADGRGDVS